MTKRQGNLLFDGMSSRIYEIRKVLYHGNNKEFAEKMGVTENYATAICNGYQKPGKRLANKILSKFPNVREEWLLHGRGEMFAECMDDSHKSVSEQGDIDNSIVGNDITAIHREHQVRLDELYRQIALKDEIIKNLTDLLLKK